MYMRLSCFTGTTLFQVEFVSLNTVRLYVNGNDIRSDLDMTSISSAHATPKKSSPIQNDIKEEVKDDDSEIYISCDSYNTDFSDSKTSINVSDSVNVQSSEDSCLSIEKDLLNKSVDNNEVNDVTETPPVKAEDSVMPPESEDSVIPPESEDCVMPPKSEDSVELTEEKLVDNGSDAQLKETEEIVKDLECDESKSPVDKLVDVKDNNVGNETDIKLKDTEENLSIKETAENNSESKDEVKHVENNSHLEDASSEVIDSSVVLGNK